MIKWLLGFVFRIIFYDKIREIRLIQSKNKDLKKIYKHKKAEKMSYPKHHNVKRARESIYLAKEIKEMYDTSINSHRETMKDIKSEIRSEYFNLFTNIAQVIPYVNDIRNKTENVKVSHNNSDIVIEEIKKDNYNY